MLMLGSSRDVFVTSLFYDLNFGVMLACKHDIFRNVKLDFSRRIIKPVEDYVSMILCMASYISIVSPALLFH